MKPRPSSVRSPLPSNPRRLPNALIGAALAALAGCSSTSDQLVVVVDSDYAVPGELSAVEVAVTADGQTLATQSFDLSARALPISFGVLPRSGDRTLPLSIEVRGSGPVASGAPLVRRTLAQFPPGLSRLPIFLARRCETEACSAGETCLEGGCTAEAVPDGSLGTVEPGQELEGLCRPGPARCSEDQTAVLQCKSWGSPEESISCPTGQSCVGDPAMCRGPGDGFRLTLTIEGDADGRVQSTPAGIDCGRGETDCEHVFPRDTAVTLTVAETAGTFAGWGGACMGTGNCVVRMDQRRGVTARFTDNPSRTLTVTLSGNGTGSVSSQPDGIACAPTCLAEFPNGTELTLSASPSPDSTFMGWTGACSGTGDCQVQMNSALVVGADFALNSGPQTLTVVPTGDGAGTVQSAPSGIDCGTECSADFPFASDVVLSAVPLNNSVFNGWLGASCSGTGTCMVTMNQAHTVVADFVQDSGTFHDLTLTKGGDGAGVVQSPGLEIDCDASCGTDTASLLQGSSIQLQATAEAGSIFDGWGGDCAGQAEICTVTMDARRAVTANFSSVPLIPVSVSVGGNGTGRVTSQPPGIDCPTSCSADFPTGTVLTLSALPASGSTFVGYTGGGCSQFSPCAVSLTAGGVNIAASFEPVVPSRYDFNNDGLADILFAAPDFDLGPTLDVGRVYLRLGSLAGPTLAPIVADQADRIWGGGGAFSQLGLGMSALDDITGDGLPDFAVGAPGQNGGAGVVHIVAGGPSLPTSGPIDMLPKPPNMSFVGLGMGRFGESLTAVGDLNGDGRSELLVGAPGAGTTDPGQAYLFFSDTIQGTGGGGVGFADVILGGSGGRFGAQVAALGDFNNDGSDDLAVGAPNHGLMGEGRVSIFFGPFRVGGPGEQRLNPDLTISGVLPNEHFGESMAALEDYNGDGVPDLAVGTRFQNAVSVFYGASMFGSANLTSADANRSFGGGGMFGSALAGADITGNGFSDVIAGAPGGSGPGRGEVLIFQGGPNSTTNAWTILVGDCQPLQTCLSEGFGVTVTPWGDLNRDGQIDLLVGADFGGGPGGLSARGRITAFYGGASLLNATSSGSPVQITGENQLDAHCRSLGASWTQ